MDVDLHLLPGSSLEGIRVVELLGCDEAELQQFFEQAPDYFIAVINQQRIGKVETSHLGSLPHAVIHIIPVVQVFHLRIEGIGINK